ncbi:MAG TPA: DUF1800 domain-containing protein, partial [Ktedonobacterales bacterium]|nr:DUF1800 domain-containing protein [Ktedonobacterales bacterium]
MATSNQPSYPPASPQSGNQSAPLPAPQRPTPYQSYQAAQSAQASYDPMTEATTQVVRRGGPTPPPAPPDEPRQGISRRTVVLGAAAGAVAVGAAGAGIGYALPHLLHHTNASPPLSLSSSNAWQINHLLRRAGFGVAPTDLNEYLSAGVSGSLDRLLNYTSIANDALDQRLSALGNTFTTPADLIRWLLTRMIYTARPLEEKLTLFWHGVLTSSFTKVGGRKNLGFMIQQDKLLRAKAMGRFDDLIYAISIDPAMLFWLDGHTSTGNSPNENYSRELMELFTMGIDTYTQADVHNGALALTGWVVRDGQSLFVPFRHYDGTITYLGETGQLGLSDVVRLVCSHPTTGGHIAWRMWNFFVYDGVQANDPVLKPLIDAYYSSNHSIAAMVKAMFNSPEFFSEKAYRARAKSPAEYVVGAVRGLGIPAQAPALNYMARQMASMGQVLFDPPNVAGWVGDAYSSNWISTQAWITRLNFNNLLVGATTGEPIQAYLAGQNSQTARRRAASQATVSNSLIQQTITAQKLRSAKDVLNYFGALLL